MSRKPKIAFYWCASCGGCEESLIDMGEELLMAAEKADIVFWPVALDARFEDVEALDEGDIDATFINGAIRLDEHVRVAQLLRRKSKRLIAHGTCAHLGGVIGLANPFESGQLLECAFRQVPSVDDPSGPLPGTDAEDEKEGPVLARLLPQVKPLDRVVPVDAFIPGCPPPPETMANTIAEIIQGRLPEPGTVFAHRTALCQQCPRLPSKPDKIEITRFRRLYDTHWDPEICFLPQGLICMGPVTRGGCDARCIQANLPCRGCFGPTERMNDFGVGAMSLIASIMAGEDDAALGRLVDSIADPTGLIYRYSMAASVLGKGPGR